MSQRSFSRSHQRRLLAQARRAEIRRRVGLSAGAVLGASAVMASAAQANTYVVTTNADAAENCTNDACTLRDAVAAANANPGADTITFASGVTGTIKLTAGQLTVTDPLTLTGPGSKVLAISGDTSGDGVAGPGDTRILEVQQPASLTLTGLELTRGFVSSTTKYDGGGALLVRSGASATLRDTALTGNATVGDGNGSPVRNRGRGGAILSEGALTVERSTLSGNSADGQGGAIAHTNELVRSPDSPYPKYTSLPLGSLTVTGSTLSGNSAENGGAISSYAGRYQAGSTAPVSPAADAIVISGSAITQNIANTGGGLSIGQGAPTVGGPGTPVGGSAARPTAPTARIVDSSITGNTANGASGGGVDVGTIAADASVALTRSTLSGNTAAGGVGGGLATGTQVSGALDVTQSTLAGNSAQDGGGASIGSEYRPATQGEGEVTLSGLTVSGNAASERSGGLELGRTQTYTYDDTTQQGTTTYSSPSQPLTSTVVAGNTAAGQPSDLGQAPLTDGSDGDGFVLSRSLVQAPGDTRKTTSTTAPSIFGVDPQLGTLGDNGGPTQTQLPAATSPLLDAGQADAGVTADQRGAARTVDLADVANGTGSDGTDIGAVERGAPVPPVPAVVAAQPAQPVPSAPAPPKPAPSSGFVIVSPTSRPNRVRKARQPVQLRGTSQAGTRKVRVAVGRKTGSKCRFLLKSGKFSAKRDCRRTLYVTAKGTRHWTLKLPKLAKGRYTVWSRAIGVSGSVERKQTTRNFQRFTVK